MEEFLEQINKNATFGRVTVSDLETAAMEKEQKKMKMKEDREKLEKEMARIEEEKKQQQEEDDLKYALLLQKKEQECNRKKIHKKHKPRGVGRGVLLETEEPCSYRSPRSPAPKSRKQPFDCDSIFEKEPRVQQELSRINGHTHYHSNSFTKNVWRCEDSDPMEFINTVSATDSSPVKHEDSLQSPTEKSANSWESYSFKSSSPLPQLTNTPQSDLPGSVNSPQSLDSLGPVNTPKSVDSPGPFSSPQPFNSPLQNLYFELPETPLPPVPVPLSPPPSPPSTKAKTGVVRKRNNRIAAKFSMSNGSDEDEEENNNNKVSQLYGAFHQPLGRGRPKPSGSLFNPAYRVLDNGLLRPEDVLRNPYNIAPGYKLKEEDFPPLS